MWQRSSPLKEAGTGAVDVARLGPPSLRQLRQPGQVMARARHHPCLPAAACHRSWQTFTGRLGREGGLQCGRAVEAHLSGQGASRSGHARLQRLAASPQRHHILRQHCGLPRGARAAGRGGRSGNTGASFGEGLWQGGRGPLWSARLRRGARRGWMGNREGAGALDTQDRTWKSDLPALFACSSPPGCRVASLLFCGSGAPPARLLWCQGCSGAAGRALDARRRAA